MNRWLHQLSSPKTSYRVLTVIQPWCWIFCVILGGFGLWEALWVAPPDYQQGDAYRILFIHVPAAALSLGIYSAMSVAALIFLIWKIKLADWFQMVSAPVGATLTLITLLTGSIWGKPTWGTFWIWDARLTSELILLFIYLGIIGLRQALDMQPKLAAQATNLLTLVGAINLPVIHFSVYWWHTLHQGATILRFGAPKMDAAMLPALFLMMGCYVCYCIGLIAVRLRREILLASSEARWVQALLNYSK